MSMVGAYCLVLGAVPCPSWAHTGWRLEQVRVHGGRHTARRLEQPHVHDGQHTAWCWCIKDVFKTFLKDGMGSSRVISWTDGSS